jgi:hypothetical protein
VGYLLGTGGESAAQRGQDLSEQLFPPLGRERFDFPAAEGICGPARDELCGPVYGLDGPGVALLVGLTPGDQPVLGEQDEPGVRIVSYGLPDLLTECEAGTDVGNPDGLLAEALGGEFLAAF